MGVRSYSEWNSYFLDIFFYKSTPGSFIRFNVSKEWLDTVPARDGMGGYLNFLSALREESQRKTVYDLLHEMLKQQRKSPMEPPQYVAALVFLCLPWTWTLGSSRAHNYWDRLKTMSTEYGIQCGRLLEQNYRFRGLLNTNNGDLLSLLQQWSTNCTAVKGKGEFVYCHLYNDPEDKVSLLRSQVWPTETDLDWMPEVLFCHTDQSKELDETRLGDFCRRQVNIQYAWTSFKNLFLSDDPLAQKVQKDALSQIYESYEDWVNEGRPVEKLTNETLRRISEDESEKRTITTLPHLWLRLKKNGPAWEKTLFLNSAEFPSAKEESDPIIDIKINGQGHGCQLTRLKSGHFLVKGQDALWNELALVEPQQELSSKHLSCGDFLYSPRKCYVMFQSSTGTFIQQDFATQGSDFFALYATVNRKRFLRWCADNDVKTGTPVGIGDGWFLHHVHGLDENQYAQFPNGLDNIGQSGLSTRLTGGIKARMGASFRRRYLRDFLPDIEAYLPQKYTVTIQNEYGEPYESDKVLREIQGDSEGGQSEENASVSHDDPNRYLVRTFSLSIPPDFTGSELWIQFRVGGEKYGRAQRIKLAPADDLGKICHAHAWDLFGDVTACGENVSYWPDTKEAEASSENERFTPLHQPDEENHDAYWRFISQLRQAQGNNGIPGKEFWAIVCSNFRSVAGWRQQIQWLSDLGILDIKTNEFGMWSRFYLNPPAFCLLPSLNGKGELQAILSGAFSLHNLEHLGQYFNITCNAQHHETGVPLPLLPPRILVTAGSDIGIEFLKEIATECKLSWGGIPAIGFARLSVPLDEWLNSKHKFFRDGNPDDKDVSGWYDMLSYRMQSRNTDGMLANPLSTCSQLFTKCLCTHPCPNIPQFEVSDLVNQEQNYSVYIKGIPWGRWVSYWLEGLFAHLRFKIAYHESTGTMLFPEALTPPRVLARSLTLCTGNISRRQTAPEPYDQLSPNNQETSYGLSIRPYQGACLCFDGVPRLIAECVAEKLHAKLKDF